MVEPHSSSHNPQSDLTNEDKEALGQLSDQLISAGFLRQPLPPTTFNGGSMEGQKLLMKAIWSMFASRSKEMTIREDLLAKQRELTYEHTRLEGFLRTTQKEKLEAQQEATASTNRANAIQKELELEKAKHRSTKDDYSKLKNAERLIKTTSIHELRKKNNELDELQRRLAKLSSNKDLVVSSSLGLGSSGPLIAKVDMSAGGRVGLLEFDLKAARDQNHHLQIENTRLREYLDLYEQQLIDLISEISDQPDLDSLDCKFIDSDDQMDEVDRWINTSNSSRLVPLPKIYKKLSLVTYKLRDKAIEHFRSLKELNLKLSQNHSVAEQDRFKLEEKHKKLRLSFEKEIEMLKISLKEAKSTMERWMNTDLANGATSTNAMEDVTFEKMPDIPPTKLKPEIDALAVERKKLAQDAMGLAKERAEIEMRKFNEERQKILKELDMDMSPAIPAPSIKKLDDKIHSNQDKAQANAGDQTIESLVVHTKPSISSSNIRTSSAIKSGKMRSSISKNLGTVHRIKLQNPIISKPNSNRNGILKSLLSITGEEDKIIENSSTTRLKTERPGHNLNLNHPESSSSLARSSVSKDPQSLARRRLNPPQSNSRLARPSNTRPN